MTKTQIASRILLVLSALALLATLCTTALVNTERSAPAGVVGIGAGSTPAEGQLGEVEVETAASSSSSFGTLAQRNAYIKCVAPNSGVDMKLRVKLLTYAGKALEGIRAGVPGSTLTAGLAKIYKLTRSEASKVYWCAMRTWTKSWGR